MQAKEERTSRDKHVGHCELISYSINNFTNSKIKSAHYFARFSVKTWRSYLRLAMHRNKFGLKIGKSRYLAKLTKGHTFWITFHAQLLTFHKKTLEKTFVTQRRNSVLNNISQKGHGKNDAQFINEIRTMPISGGCTL